MPLLLYHTLFFLLFGQLASCLDVSISLTAPATAFVSQSLVSLSIEQDRWTDWAGNTSRNDFFFNTLDNLQQLTGLPPQIRIGANSEDHTNFGYNVQVVMPLTYRVTSLANCSCQFSELGFPPVTSIVPYPEAKNITVGNGYYGAAQFLPSSDSFFYLVFPSLPPNCT